MKILSASNFTGQIEIWCGHERRGWRPPPVGPARAGAPDRGEHLSSHSSQPSTVTKSHSTASALHTTQERPSTCLTLTACVSTPARRRALSSGALPRRIVPITLLLLLSLRRASSTHSLRPSAASGSTFHCRQVFTHTLPHPLPSCHTLPHPPPPPICHTSRIFPPFVTLPIPIPHRTIPSRFCRSRTSVSNATLSLRSVGRLGRCSGASTISSRSQTWILKPSAVAP